MQVEMISYRPVEYIESIWKNYAYWYVPTPFLLN